MQTVRINRTRRHKGFTLVELLLVLVILAATAGIVIPMLPSVNKRAHGSTGASNIASIAMLVQTHEALYNEHPDNLDSLIDSDDTIFFDGTLHLQATELITATNGRIIEALGDIGITVSREMDSDAEDQTFGVATGNAYDLTSGAGGEFVATLTVAGAAALNLEATGSGVEHYVAFGFGDGSTAIGKSITEAPIHFPEGAHGPIDDYSRFAVIYAIPEEGPARLAAVAAIHDGELSGLNNHLLEYYETFE